jgi:hypothetical protein
MRKATETLVHTTWLGDDPLFACHDNVTDVNWEAVENLLYDGHYNQEQQTLISVLAFLSNYENLDSISLYDIHQLNKIDRIAILDALRIHWDGVQLQEDL